MASALDGFVETTSYRYEVNGIYYLLLVVKTYIYNSERSNETITYYAQVTGPADIRVKEVIIPDSVVFHGTTFPVTSIDKSAFSDCCGLTSITIPNSVTSIGDKAFSGCKNLKNILMPPQYIQFCQDVFLNTFWYDNQEEGLIYIGTTLYGYKGNIPEETSIAIKDGTTSIGTYAFRNCIGLTSITIPSSVTTIGEYNQEIKGETNVEIIPVSA